MKSSTARPTSAAGGSVFNLKQATSRMPAKGERLIAEGNFKCGEMC
jgi:hypothetical protein